MQALRWNCSSASAVHHSSFRSHRAWERDVCLGVIVVLQWLIIGGNVSEGDESKLSTIHGNSA